jgi:hypothetical protein
VEFPDSLGWTAEQKQKIINRGYAHQRFLDQTGYEAVTHEMPVWSQTFGLAGTIDSLGKFTKGRYAGQYGIVDIKSGPPLPTAILQVALYDILYGVMGYPIKLNLRVILHLREDGQPRPEYRDAETGQLDRGDALSVLRVYQFMKKHKLNDTRG